MALDLEFIDAVDLFLKTDKRLIGADDHPQWSSGRDIDTVCLKLPLEVNGEIIGQTLYIQARSQLPSLNFSIGIVFESCICRLDYCEDTKHLNPIGSASEGLVPLIVGPHYHSWEANRNFLSAGNKAFKLKRAVPFTNARMFDAALRWFCGENRIVLPSKLTIEIPSRSRLI